ncbi:MAG TPA: hypothetical protein VHQ43_12385 [Solirubrobacterales bacterium]|jgi:hypothetical protein|nr:hypothetical protein [Solirubrobacterales bacterium]
MDSGSGVLLGGAAAHDWPERERGLGAGVPDLRRQVLPTVWRWPRSKLPYAEGDREETLEMA